MKLKRVFIHGFKNLDPLVVDISQGISGFWGNNGQGKSNFLEAVYITLKGKSFRPYSSKEDWIPQKAKRPLGIRLEFDDSLGADCVAEIKQGSEGSLSYWLNEKKTKAWSLSQKFPVVVFSPDDHSLIRESPDLRRDYLDAVFSEVCPGYAEVLDRFEKALKNRNRLLKRLQKEEIRLEMALRHEELRTWTQVLAIAAEEIMSLRREVWPEYRRHFLDITKSLFEEALSDLDISYEHDSKEKLNKFDKLEYYHLIQDSLATDLATGWTHRGPHRDDFSMWLGGLDARSKASQGQARLLALALRWTHAVWAERQRGEIPLFLIDDFSNELDGLRRKKLLDLLGTNSGQILMTGTDAKSVDSSSLSAYRKYEVEDGKIREVTLNGG